MIKKELIIGLISLAVVLFVVLSVFKGREKTSNSALRQIPQGQQKSEEGSDKQPAMMETIILTEEIVGTHDTPEDCWFIIDDKVYDVTDYDQHPGGRDRIEAFCGKDATGAFETKGEKGQPHSQSAIEMRKNFYYADLGEEIEN